ncbi:MAG: hypothetical protein M5U28_04590 [Sandaracinaceae bacterium]|nr:hypothetical protein [Sandaracinaceae bacterium]
MARATPKGTIRSRPECTHGPSTSLEPGVRALANRLIEECGYAPSRQPLTEQIAAPVAEASEA